MAPPAVAWRVILMGLLVSDCSVGKFELQVGKKGNQVGKFDGQVGKIALQVGIAIFWRLKRVVSSTEKAFGGAKSSHKGFTRHVLQKKVLEWPRPLSLGGHFDGIFGTPSWNRDILEAQASGVIYRKGFWRSQKQ